MSKTKAPGPSLSKMLRQQGGRLTMTAAAGGVDPLCPPGDFAIPARRRPTKPATASATQNPYEPVLK